MWLLTALLFSAVASAAEPDGKVVYEKWCLPCHRQGQVGAVELQNKYRGSTPAVLTERTDLTAALVKLFVRKGAQVMPIFRKTEISDAELNALTAYLSAPSDHAR